MINAVLVLIGAAICVLWGTAHLFPTKNIVSGFGDISEDNKNIIRMEWINEGLTLIFIGTMIALVTIMGSGNTKIIVYGSTAVMLLGMAMLSLFTGFKVKFFAFRLCPIIFTTASLLILQAMIWN